MTTTKQNEPEYPISGRLAGEQAAYEQGKARKYREAIGRQFPPYVPTPPSAPIVIRRGEDPWAVEPSLAARAELRWSDDEPPPGWFALPVAVREQLVGLVLALLSAAPRAKGQEANRRQYLRSILSALVRTLTAGAVPSGLEPRYANFLQAFVPSDADRLVWTTTFSQAHQVLGRPSVDGILARLLTQLDRPEGSVLEGIRDRVQWVAGKLRDKLRAGEDAAAGTAQRREVLAAKRAQESGL